MSTQKAVTIHRFTATAHLGRGLDNPRTPDPGARIGRLLAGVATRWLDQAVQQAELPTGTWCLRRLDVPVRLDLTATDAAVKERWATTLAAALAAALRNPDLAIRFNGERDALADLVAGIATGQLDRRWAWRQLDLLQPGDPDPGAAPRAALLAAVTRRSRHALAAVALAVERVGLPALHRTLGQTGWVALAEVVGHTRCPPTGPVDRAGEGGGVVERQLAERLVASSSLSAVICRSNLRPDRTTLQAWAILVAAAADPTVLQRVSAPAVLAAVTRALAAAVRFAPPLERTPAELSTVITSPARNPTPKTASEQAAAPPPLTSNDAPAETSPVVGPNSGGGTKPQATNTTGDPNPVTETAAAPPFTSKNAAHAAEAHPEQLWPARLADPEVSATNPIVRGGAVVGKNCRTVPSRIATADSSANRAEEPADPPSCDTPDTGHRTEHAGVLFLLATASAAGVPHSVLDIPALAARTLPWILYHVAAGVGVPQGDPAAAAFAGLDPGHRLVWFGDDPATPTELAALEVVCGGWAHVTAEAMAHPHKAEADVVSSVMRRTGVIRYSSGWIDVQMRSNEVDLDVRRAGLDIDPGWVPWLGTVVRYIYE